MPQLPKEPTEKWREREQERFEKGIYEELPPSITRYLSQNPATKEHFAHLDIDGKGLIAFTEDERRGEADTQKVIKVRRYLRTFFGTWLQTYYSYTQATVDDMIEEMATHVFSMVNKPQVLLAMNPDHIRWVLSHSGNIHDIRANEDGSEYVITGSDVPEKHRGCPSCMTYPPEGSRLHGNSGYKCRPIMPCEVYGYGDLAIAHMVSPDNPNLVKSRVVVWPDKKIISGGNSGYFKGRDGWEEKLKVGLSDMGYTVGHIRGAKMYRWEHSSSVIAPYLDGDDGLIDHGNYLEITHNDNDADYIADQIDGIANRREEEEEYCFACDGYYTPDDMSGMYHDEGRICTGCEDEYFVCLACDVVTNNDDWVEVSGHGWCRSCADDDAFFCLHCDTTMVNEELAGEDENGESICNDCVNDSDEYAMTENGCVGVVVKELVTLARCGCCSEDTELSREEA